jgi:DNA polymerase-4/protein ImuB
VPIACLAVPSLALACELSGQAELTGKAIILTDELRSRVIDRTEAAARYGVEPGMPLRKATTLYPAALVLQQRTSRVAGVAELLVEALATVSPFVEEAEPGLVYADLNGLEGLYPGQGMVEQAILAAVPAGLHARLGIAENRFTSYVAARCAPPGEALRIEAGNAGGFLAEKPASWLPLHPDTTERLQMLGIRTIGDFAALPRQAVEAQFGAAGGRAWLAARGEDATTLRPRPFEQERVVEHAQAQPPLISKESVTLTVEQLLIRALRHPRALNRFVCSVRLRAVTDTERLWERVRVLREPAGGRERLWAAIRPLLEFAEYPGPIAELELELGGLTAESGRQPSLLNAERVRKREQLDDMVRQLKARYGYPSVARVVEVEPWSRIPERRHALMDYDP